MTKIGSIRVNAVEYRSGVVIEEFSYHNGHQLFWAVPAWEERGDLYPNLQEPFQSAEQAQIKAEEVAESMGLVVLPPVLSPPEARNKADAELSDEEVNRHLMALAIAMTKSSTSGSPIMVRQEAADVKIEMAKTISELLAIDCVAVDYNQVLFDLWAPNNRLRDTLEDHDRAAAIIVLEAPSYQDEYIVQLRQRLLSPNQFLVLFTDGEAPPQDSRWTVIG